MCPWPSARPQTLSARARPRTMKISCSDGKLSVLPAARPRRPGTGPRPWLPSARWLRFDPIGPRATSASLAPSPSAASGARQLGCSLTDCTHAARQARQTRLSGLSSSACATASPWLHLPRARWHPSPGRTLAPRPPPRPRQSVAPLQPSWSARLLMHFLPCPSLRKLRHQLRLSLLLPLRMPRAIPPLPQLAQLQLQALLSGQCPAQGHPLPPWQRVCQNSSCCAVVQGWARARLQLHSPRPIPSEWWLSARTNSEALEQPLKRRWRQPQRRLARRAAWSQTGAT
mmetsp:Transcript_13444/g.35881  ORF Transcript_13444/g.35881 Transcript_13444/m.35881 type:complete len:286 (-) Transcript_13444:1568-2425(-)